MEKYSSLHPEDNASVESLLHGGDETRLEDDGLDSFTSKYRNGSWLERHKIAICVNALLLSLDVYWVSSFTPGLIFNTPITHFSNTYPTAPARDVIRYEGQQLDLPPVYLPNGTLNPERPGHFNGKPTPQLAEDWKSIMQQQNIRLQRYELGRFAHDDSIIQLADGSGYFATLAVFHGLHCLKRFHHYIHRDSYYPNMTEENDARLLYHTEHCVDWLRQ